MVRLSAHSVGEALYLPTVQTTQAVSSRVRSLAAPGKNLALPAHVPGFFFGEQLVALFLYCPSEQPLQTKPFRAPAHVPCRTASEGQARLAHAVQVNWLVVPLQEPARNSSFGQFVLSHCWHVPFLSGLDWARNWLLVQAGCFAHVPFCVGENPSRNCPSGHDGWLTHTPLLVGDCPDRYSPDLHLEWALHVKPLVVPAHVPARYWPDAQLMFEQVLHLKPLVVPLHEPL